MSYKFNRNCWVESLEERLFCAKGRQSEAGDDEAGEKNFQTPKIQTENSGGLEASVSPTIEEKIASAESLFARWGNELKKEERICRLTRRLETNLENCRESMHDLGIVQACVHCDENAPEGSCCSLGLERKYSPILLLMNLMLGASLPEWRLRADSCYFLGPKGCGLKVRHMLCVDYLCPELEEALGQKSLIKIQTVSGEEILSAFLLQEAIREIVKKLSQ